LVSRLGADQYVDERGLAVTEWTVAEVGIGSAPVDVPGSEFIEV
jgi:hypothetical protein